MLHVDVVCRLLIYASRGAASTAAGARTVDEMMYRGKNGIGQQAADAMGRPFAVDRQFPDVTIHRVA